MTSTQQRTPAGNGQGLAKVVGVRVSLLHFQQFSAAAGNFRLASRPASQPLTPGELGRALVEVFLENKGVREIVERHLKSST